MNATCCALCRDAEHMSEPLKMPLRFCGGSMDNVRIVAVERRFVLPLTDGRFDPGQGELHEVCRHCWEFHTYGGRLQ